MPTDDAGQSDLTRHSRADRRVARAPEPRRASWSCCSQVPPGFTRALGAPPAAQLYYQVETLVFGRAVERATQPERYIVGCADPGQAACRAVSRPCSDAFGCPILPMRYESAELAKISINCCLVASVTVANTLAELCERDRRRLVGDRAGAQARPAHRAVQPISRPGLGIAGGNLERDLATVRTIGGRTRDRCRRRAGVDKPTAGTGSDWAARTIRTALLDSRPDATIAVLGSRLQGEHPLDEELTVARNHRAA